MILKENKKILNTYTIKHAWEIKRINIYDMHGMKVNNPRVREKMTFDYFL